MRRYKEPSGPRQLPPPWLAGAMIGLTISTMATGAIMFGAGLAFSQAIIRGK